MIDDEAVMRGVNLLDRISIGEVNVRNLEPLGKRLQLAMTVRHAHCANVIAFREQQFEDSSPVLAQPVGISCHFHTLLNARHAGGKKSCSTLHLNQAQTASYNRGKTLAIAESPNENVVLLC